MPLFTPTNYGVWTPVLTFATPGNLSVTYGSQIGNYVQLGKLVKVFFRVETSAFTHSSASGGLQLTGVPFTSRNTSTDRWIGEVHWEGITKTNYTDIKPAIASNATTITFVANGSGQAGSSVAAADMPTGGSVVLRGCIDFIAA